MQTLVKKWGGENASELDKSPKTLKIDTDKHQVVVVSAIRSADFNTTDHLIILAHQIARGKEYLDDALDELDTIRNFHIETIQEKLTDHQELLDLVMKKFDNLKALIHKFLNNTGRQIVPSKSNDYSLEIDGEYFSLLGFGEYISAIIQQYVIEKATNTKTKMVKFGKSVERINSVSRNGNELFENLALYIGKKVHAVLEKGHIAVVPGYIAGFRRGIENAIGRGYSDATASITAVGLSRFGHGVTLEIQKAVPGIMSADPRLLEHPQDAKIIPKLDYITAKEITGVRGAQAKLLHPQTLRSQLQLAGIKVRLYNPFTSEQGSLISQEKNNKSKGIEFVGGRDNVVFFTVSSSIMEESGILAKIFSTVQKYGTVDIVGTSQTEVSFTIDETLGEEKIEALCKELHTELGIEKDAGDEYITYKKNKALVYCIGQNISHHLGMIGQITTELGKHAINIELISQGIGERAIVLGIDGNDYQKAINVLHNTFISKK